MELFLGREGYDKIILSYRLAGSGQEPGVFADQCSGFGDRHGGAQKFALQDRIGKLAGFFTILAILISCLGLFGLASFVAEQRVKEIGVRKILGASVFRLWGLLSKEFVLLVGIGFALAAPLALDVMQNWLLQYHYRVTISVWVFVVTMGLALLITLTTVSWQAVRAARANPVKSLRTE